MNTLIICNTTTEELLKEKYISNSNTKKSNFSIVTDSNSFNKFKLEKSKPDNIWILVELMWSNDNYLQGYDFALKLMETNYAKVNPLQITFFSLLSREYLFIKTTGLLSVFPKSFIHNNLLESSIKTSSFSIEKWKYTRKYGLTLSGIIDKLFHDFSDILRYETEFDNKDEVKQLIQRLFNISDLLSNDLKKLLQKITVGNYNTYRLQLTTELTDILIYSNNKSKQKIYKPKKTWRPAIMLIEDDFLFAELLMKKLSESFDITHFNNGNEAITILKKQGILYNGLICDLELLVPFGYDQEFQGIDIIQFVEKHYPHMVINILTNMPKSGIKDMFPNLASKKIRYKSTFKTYPKLEWDEYSSYLIKEFKLKSKVKYLQGPNTSIWENISNQNKNGGGLKTFYYNFKINDKNGFNKFWKEIKLIYKNVKLNDENISISFGKTKDRNILIQTNNNDRILQLLKNLLLHRLFWLDKLYDKGGFSYYSLDTNDVKYFENKFAFFKETTALKDKRHNTYSSIIGFPIHKENENRYKFIFKSLFPEEIIWLKKNIGIEEFDFINEFSYLSNIIYSILQIISDANPHVFIKENYSTPLYPNKIIDIEKFFLTLSNEKEKRSKYESRDKVLNLLLDFKENAIEEYNKLDGALQTQIDDIIYRFETHSKYS